MGKIIRRNYSILAGDYEKVKMFLRENYVKYCANGFWPESRWEYVNTLMWYKFYSSHRNGLWEDDGKIVAIATYEMEPGEAYIFISEGYEFLRPEVINYAEQTLYKINEEGKKELRICSYSFQPEVMKYLEDRDYMKQYEDAENVYDITNKLPKVVIPDGFEIITLNEVEPNDYKRLNDMIWQGFDHDGEGVLDGFLMTVNAPGFRKELTYIARAENGDFCAYASIRMDESQRFGYLDPLCTHPRYRKKGLAKALLYTAINDVAKLGAKYMTGGDNKFYNHIGYESRFYYEWYKKVW